MPVQYNSKTTGSELVRGLADNIKGKVILTTGVSPGGLGAQFVETVAAASPALLIIAGRNTAKVQQTADAIAKAHPGVKTRPLRLDLGSLAAVREAAAEVNSWDDVPAIDVLVNNAGIMASQFGANHLGHFLFTNLIMGKILVASKPRVVNVSSDGHRLSPIRFYNYNFDGGKNYHRWTAYGQSKTANMLMALSLGQKLASSGLLAVSVHPGVIASNLLAHLDVAAAMEDMWPPDRTMGNQWGWDKDLYEFKTADGGVATHVFGAFHPLVEGHNGAYLLDAHVADPYTDTYASWARDPIEADKLWRLSEKLVGQEFAY
ncbi:hypothetical protein C8A03DRAFT_42982 [Achaetomium macrosporum]|uniref:Short-chain dehydrogenase n=1 Tax=Achaetomium macrosporum TaxID=79813 RepID=A0AAN7HC49_9PEZI|nr:hypothetical protein C8A03DRAFT_42982 [Achaetomium macrosporum]